MGATPAQVREHYDVLALIYRAFWGDHIHHGFFLRGDETPAEAQVNLLNFCATLVGVQQQSRVFDVGCGHGGTALFLARNYGCEVLGLTLSEKQARLAAENACHQGLEHRVRFEVGDAGRFPFGTAQYDLVWTMESSEHFTDKPAYFHRSFESLVPGGRLLVAAWTGSMKHGQVRAVADAFLCPSLLTAQEYAHLMRAAGLEVFECRDVTEQVARTWEICLERSCKSSPLLPLLPRTIREFVAGIPVILDAYRSGTLRYSVLAARK